MRVPTQQLALVGKRRCDGVGYLLRTRSGLNEFGVGGGVATLQRRCLAAIYGRWQSRGLAPSPESHNCFQAACRKYLSKRLVDANRRLSYWILGVHRIPQDVGFAICW